MQGLLQSVCYNLTGAFRRKKIHDSLMHFRRLRFGHPIGARVGRT